MLSASARSPLAFEPAGAGHSKVSAWRERGDKGHSLQELRLEHLIGYVLQQVGLHGHRFARLRDAEVLIIEQVQVDHAIPRGALWFTHDTRGIEQADDDILLHDNSLQLFDQVRAEALPGAILFAVRDLNDRH